MMALYPSIGTTSSLAAISSQILTKATVAKKHIWRVVVLGVMRSNEYIFCRIWYLWVSNKDICKGVYSEQDSFFTLLQNISSFHPPSFFPSKKGKKEKCFQHLLFYLFLTPPTYDIFLVFSQIYFYPSTFEWLLSSFQRRYVIHVLRRIIRKKQVSLNWLW